MATDTGILQALWSEMKPAVEARDASLCKPIARLVNRGKTLEAMARWNDVLSAPAAPDAPVWLRLSAVLSVSSWGDLPPDVDAVRSFLWSEVLRQKTASLLNCRLLLDEPWGDRVWLQRHGSWILYRWGATRFLGTPFKQVLEALDEGLANAQESLLELRVAGRVFVNPKLPPI